MSITVTDVYNSLMSSAQYSSNLKISGNQISVYLDIPVKQKDRRISTLTDIKNFLQQKFPNTPIAYNKTGKGSTVGRIEIPILGKNDIVVKLKPIPKPPSNVLWKLNEVMMEDMFYKYKEYTVDEDSKINLIITDSALKTIIVNDVKSVNNVGQKNKKSDLKITKVNGKEINISIKLPKFRTWHNQANNNSIAVSGATKVLDNIPNIKGAFGRGSIGVSVKSTVSEVKEFCFGGDGMNKVDYVIVANLPNKPIQESFNYDDNLKTLFVTVDKIYDRNQYEEVSKNCYMLIESNPSLNIGNKYRGFKISYVPKSIADNALPGKR